MTSEIFVGSWRALACKIGIRKELPVSEKSVYAAASSSERKKSVHNQSRVYKGSENHRGEVWKTNVSSIVASWEEYNA